MSLATSIPNCSYFKNVFLQNIRILQVQLSATEELQKHYNYYKQDL